ncbi:helix-turn-helix transcriptional regulator [Paenibacillus sp. PsM32]|uniref:helix-turn-helix transcriptional regulator n=1 Tax=Paenibacillus sp. PsM32 TaxID=3030536 RepID=UPI00263B5971|nr:helix-turn-helix transcriptional regulator [Paenibacillus sp. PsM32]MDN4618062.1 helix-turn-helix transcriptional regulator [Paenibacillus sp. PsM32]
MLEVDRQSELGDFLKNRRARILPAHVGLPEHGRRRTPGLRRAEVAMLAGVSVDWYTYLEQGRDIQVSIQVLESIARVLQLDEFERKHLFVLAHCQLPPYIHPPQLQVSDTVQRFLDQLGHAPACAIDPKLNVLSWNKAFSVVYGDYSYLNEQDRNLLWRTFTSTEFIALKGSQWKEHALRLVAQFRARYARFIEDPWYTDFVMNLQKVSEPFRELWELHEVLDAPEGRKIILHPLVKELAFEHISFQSLDSPDIQILVNIALPEFDTARKLAILIDQK